MEVGGSLPFQTGSLSILKLNRNTYCLIKIKGKVVSVLNSATRTEGVLGERYIDSFTHS